MVRSAAGLWMRALATCLSALVFSCFYFFVRQHLKDGIWRFDLTVVNKALGATSLFLIALSMFLTGVAFFSRRTSKPLAFRKHHGLMGFWVGLLHGSVTHFLLPAVGLRPERKVPALLSDSPGLIALVVFGVMAFLSISRVKAHVGGETWRKLLRYGGYAGLILAAGHAVLLKGESWVNFFRTFDPLLPSLSLPVAGFAAAAVALRLAAWIAKKKRRA